jgi:protein-tyrosine phosphatase
MNTRDLGGYPIVGGKTTAYKKFIRSDLLYEISEQDIDILLNNNINTIIDLRNDDEIVRKPCALKNTNGFQYFHYKIYGDGRIPKSAEDVPVSYIEMVNEHILMLPIMKILSTAKDGVIFHCTAGKDRTGVISALLLSLAGVDKSDILADYQISQSYLYSFLKDFCMKNIDIASYIITPKIEYMDSFLNMFYKKYHSVEDYLLYIGLDFNDISNLKQKLINNNNNSQNSNIGTQ